MSDNPLVLISKAERALAQAVDITELMDLRAIGKAAEAAAVALGMGEAAQHAKVFQVRAERKAGAWLSENIKLGRPNEMSHDATISLGDLDIDRSTSSRWQTLASIPEEKFNSFVDDHVAKGWEVTAGGLRSYARNVNGHEPQPRRLGGIYLIPPPGVCGLAGYKLPCSGRLTGQHILNKSKARGNEEVRAILVTCPEEVMAQVCELHNVDRWADQPDARRILLLQNIYRFGWVRMANFFDGLPWKVPHPELTLEGMLE